MPPASQSTFDQTDRLIPAAQKTAVGPVVGIVIIVALLMLGALYFWGARLNEQVSQPTQANSGPLSLPNVTSTTVVQ